MDGGRQPHHGYRAPDGAPLPAGSTQPAELSFEEALATLEETVEELRSDGLSLARALDLYEQGTRLAGYCEEMLTSAELRLSRLDADSPADLWCELGDLAPGQSAVVAVHAYMLRCVWTDPDSPASARSRWATMAGFSGGSILTGDLSSATEASTSNASRFRSPATSPPV